MIADILTIGDEILIGQVVNTNSAFIGDELTKLGIQVNRIISVSDNSEAIVKALDNSLGSVDLIVITGGLGPTNDDITKKTLATYFGVKLVRNNDVLAFVQELLKNRGVQFSELNSLQADVPENCTILMNRNGTAPGMLFKTEDNKIIVSLPGVPFEMRSLITDELIPWLRSNVNLPYRAYKTFLTTGVPESTMAQRLVHFEAEMPANMSLAYLPSPGLLRLRLGIAGKSEETVRETFQQMCKKLELELGKDLFGIGNTSLQEVIGQKLLQKKLTLSTAESCTGGNIAHLITEIPGASAYFKGGIVAYSNEIKTGFLGVNASDIEKFGAVSRQVVMQMAEGIRKKFNTDFALATSGIAGPAGGSTEKPVGTVWFAISSQTSCSAIKLNFGEHRERTITRSSLAALNILRLEIDKIVEKTV